MSKSPYLSQELKEYIKQHNIEENLSNIVNELLVNVYEDPYSYLVLKLEDFTQNSINIVSVKAFEVLNNEASATIQIIFTLKSKLKQYQICSQVSFAYSNSQNKFPVLFDQEEQRFGGKGMKKICDVINNEINSLIQNQNCLNQKKIDELLQDFFKTTEQKYINAVNPISFSLQKIVSNFTKMPAYKSIQQAFEISSPYNVPSLMVNILQGGKSVNSKCKVSKYVLLFNSQEEINLDQIKKISIIMDIVNAVKKTICSGKSGEAALKYSPDGSFICHLDTIMDNLKVLEDAINASGHKQLVNIGLVWDADQLYNAEQKKYELENPKQLFDTDQLIDYYLKLAIDKPIITYMEDPIFSEDIDGWFKLANKFKDAKLKLGSKKLYSSLEVIDKLTIVEKKEETPSRLMTPDQQQEEQIRLQKEKEAQEAALKEAEEKKKQAQAQAAKKQDKKPAKGQPAEKVEEVKQDLGPKIIHLDYAVYPLQNFPVMTQLFDVWKKLNQKSPKTQIVLQENQIETSDTMLVDVAFALNSTCLNLNPAIQFERKLKYNRLIELSNYNSENQEQQNN